MKRNAIEPNANAIPKGMVFSRMSRLKGWFAGGGCTGGGGGTSGFLGGAGFGSVWGLRGESFFFSFSVSAGTEGSTGRIGESGFLH